MLTMENDTLLKEIKEMAPKLTEDLSDETINEFISQASTQALLDHLPEKKTIGNKVVNVYNLGVKYLTLHLISVLALDDGDNTISEKVDQVEIKYSDRSTTGWLNSSVWGKAYENLLSQVNTPQLPIISEH